MPNVNSSPAGAASASLVIESSRQQTSAPAVAEVQTPKAVTLSTGEQVQLEAYTVKKGDTLWDIAGVKMGNPSNWPLLFALNKDQIRNPDLIHPGQVLTVPAKIQVAPSVPQQPISNPVDSEPITPSQPAEPAQPAAQTPAQTPDHVPAEPAEPAAQTPTQTPAQPAEPAAVVLRPPEELPQPAPETPAPVVTEQPQPQPAAPTTQPQPQTQPAGPPAVVGKPPEPAKGTAIGKAALIGGAIGTAGAGAALIGMTAKIGSNLGGYATAQVVAKGINSVTGKIGLNLPTGPALSKLVSKVGGPKVAGTVAAVGTGLVVAGLAAGGYYVYKKVTDKDEAKAPATPANNTPPLPAKAPEAPPPQATQPAAASQPPPSAPAVKPLMQEEVEWALKLQSMIQNEGYKPTQEDAVKYNDIVERSQALEAAANQPAQPAQPASPAPAGEATPVANLNPVVDPNAKPPVDVKPLFTQLDKLLAEKKYMFVGGAAQPEQVRQTGVQIWLDGQLNDRVKLANSLVNNGQSELLGRIMAHQDTSSQEIAKVMSQPQFPVGAYMKGIDDNQAFQVLNSLGTLAAGGDKASASVIAQTVTAYDGWRDREAPFTRLRTHFQANGDWNKLPADLRGKIDELLK